MPLERYLPPRPVFQQFGEPSTPGTLRLVSGDRRTEQPRTLLQEMKLYIADRQVLREQGTFVAAGKEPRIDIPRADALHNDLHAILYFGYPGVPIGAQRIYEISNPSVISHVFDAYAVGEMSLEKKREVLEDNESFAATGRRLQRERPHEVKKSMSFTHAEIETAAWLLHQVGVDIDVPEGDTAIPFATMIFETRRRAGM